MAKRAYWGCLLFLCVCVGCGVSPVPPGDGATFAQAPPTVAPLFVLLSGWNTCQSNGIYGSYSPYNSGMYKPYSAMVRRFAARSGLQPKLLATCFGKTSSFYYVVGQKDKPREATYDRVLSMLRIMYRATPDTPVYIIGHSHGGWLSMYVTQQLGGLLQPRRLYTIDPISRTQCTPSVMTKAYVSSAFSLHPAAGCTRAPADFSSQVRQQLRGYVGTWQHFYQSDYPLLHSSYQGYAHHNRMLQFDNSSWFAYRAHMQIAADPRVWSAIEQDLFRDYGLSGSP